MQLLFLLKVGMSLKTVRTIYSAAHQEEAKEVFCAVGENILSV